MNYEDKVLAVKKAVSNEAFFQFLFEMSKKYPCDYQHEYINGWNDALHELMEFKYRD